MSIVEIYKDKKDTAWYNDETFLCVFDDNNNLIKYYDFCSGLKIVQNEKNMTIYINKKDLVNGKWILFANKNNMNNEKERVVVEGFHKGDESFKNSVISNNPENCANGPQVSEKEIFNRLDICLSCPLFDLSNISCKENNRIVLDLIKYENEYCPKEKWGNKEEVLKKLSANGNTVTRNIKIDQKEQEEFEKELEEYLKGL